MFVGILPADVSLLAGLALGLLAALQLMLWFDLPKGRSPVATPALSESIAALIELDKAHADATEKESVAAKAKADHDAALASAAAKRQQLQERLAAAYPIPGGTPPAGAQPPAAPPVA
jgi:hypothetical protein